MHLFLHRAGAALYGKGRKVRPDAEFGRGRLDRKSGEFRRTFRRVAGRDNWRISWKEACDASCHHPSYRRMDPDHFREESAHDIRWKGRNRQVKYMILLDQKEASMLPRIN